MAPLLIDLPQMVDMALATPEVGVTNFTVLHSLLHVIVHQLNVPSHRIEFVGRDHEALEQMIPAIPKQRVNEVVEYKIPNPKNIEQRQSVVVNEDQNIIKTILSVHLHPEGKQQSHRKPPGIPVQILSAEDFRTLENKGTSVHDTATLMLPNDNELMEPGNEEMQNTTKQIDALETTVQRLAEMIQHINTELELCECLENDPRSSNQEIFRHSSIIITDDQDKTDLTKTQSANQSKGSSKLPKKKRGENPNLDEFKNVVDHLDKETINVDGHQATESEPQQGLTELSNSEILAPKHSQMFPNKESEAQQTTTAPLQESLRQPNNCEATLDQAQPVNETPVEEANSLIQIANKKSETTINNMNEIIQILSAKFNDKILKFENLFKHTMQEIQDMLDAKLDKLCIPPLKQYISDHLEAFQDQLSYFAEQFGIIPNAAGTTCRLIRNLDCLSCGQIANQKEREMPLFMPKMYNSKPSTLLRDNSRGGEKTNTQSTTMNDGKKRFCGGQHTCTTPDERHLQKGNFIEQWGDAGPNVKYSIGYGRDGRVFRVSEACRCPVKNRIGT